jgi:hypothetical protein
VHLQPPWLNTPIVSEETHLPMIESLMLRGARGELITHRWFQSIRQQNANSFALITFGTAVVLTLSFQLMTARATTPGLVLVLMVTYPLWLILGYLYIALGTKLAHHFLQWGICMGGILVSLVGVWGAVSVMDVDRSVDQWLGMQVAPTGLIIFELVFDIAMAVLFAYLGLLVHRGIAGLSRGR